MVLIAIAASIHTGCRESLDSVSGTNEILRPLSRRATSRGTAPVLGVVALEAAVVK